MTASDFLRHCFDAGVAAVLPEAALAKVPLPEPLGTPWLIAVGKAAEGMATALEARFAARGTPIGGGLVIGAAGGGAVSPTLQRLVGDHPVPGEGSFAAAAALEAFVARLPSEAEVHVAISGGASALMAGPQAGRSPAEVVETFARLHRAGTPIAEMNAARRRVTRWSGGRLAEALAPRPVHCWLISDVPDDDPATIGSGPCVTTPPSERVTLTLVASNTLALEAAARAAAARGVVQRVHAETMRGEAREVGRAIAVQAMRAAEEWQRQNAALLEDGHGDAVRPLLLVWGGETTVALGDGDGLGGRAQELALAAAEMLDISPLPITLLAAGTDGRDGPTDAAGAVVDQESWRRLTELGDPGDALSRHDSHRALDRIGALLRTGPTGTNVMDLVLVVVGWEAQAPGGD
jgi:hydroxypyruvate reductase